MMEINKPLRATEISAALAVGVIALLILGLQPILLGELAARKLLSLEGIGLVAMAEIVALGLGALLGDLLLPITRMRAITAISAVVVGLCDISAVGLRGNLQFALSRTGCGLAEGVLVWVATCTIMRCSRPEKVAGIFLTSQTLAQALIAACTALLVIPLFGWKGGFATLGLLGLLILAMLPGLRVKFEPLAEIGSNRPPINAVTILTMLVVFLQMSAIGSIWPYLDPLGRQFGLDPRFLQMLVALVLVCQVIGGALATISVSRVKTAKTLLLVASIQGLVALTIYSASTLSQFKFAGLWAAFGLLWLFAMPFHVRLALLADSKGRVAMLVPALQLLGTAFGPLLSSFLVTESQPRLVALICACFTVTAAALLTVLNLLRRRLGASLTPDAHQAEENSDLLLDPQPGGPSQ